MKQTDLIQLCPYTGLRPFTEDESLYFKGRDAQINQIIALLEQNRFLMVTGASGEGKSSVVYAGLVPNARAGFFKAKYPNWVVADFRPERTPLHNMSEALAREFGSQPATVETELKRGYSSLVDLYVNSDYYHDEENEAYKSLDEKEQRSAKRGAANLLILVDQFEEFFTNPENFHGDQPSQDSQIVVNLILETARIALKRGLPIYIVCTMRSDFIGQCSAFRGLAEYIGFSQFFVPRLKRRDLKQVIEEPAILNGNSISQRLIERLLFDLSEGVDQLPILQHALSQIWLAADHGLEEMDLLHYAKVGGLPPEELNEEDQKKYNEWFLGLKEYEKELHRERGLNKVIEIHANLLYESAYDHFVEKYPNRELTQREVKNIIGIAFACLTKIDNSRAVRNRMSLKEITDIINNPVVTSEMVGYILTRFREEGNSFIRPYVTEDPETEKLSPDSVLDITHESLIRSWDKLNKWLKKEYEYYVSYLDLKQQMDRWKQHGKSRSFLLPIGPLSYFENWYESCKPNSAWINRYLNPELDDKYREASEVLTDIKDFLSRSARKVMVSRAFMKYGSLRIAGAVASLIVLVLIGFYWYDARQKLNENVIERIQEESGKLILSDYVDEFTVGGYLIAEERNEPGAAIRLINAAPTSQGRLRTAIFTYFEMTWIDKKFNDSFKMSLVDFIHQELESENYKSADLDFRLTNEVRMTLHLVYDRYYNPSKALDREVEFMTDRLYPLIKRFYSDPTQYKSNLIENLNQATQLWLTFGNPEPGEIKELLAIISPLETQDNRPHFSAYYPAGSYVPNGYRPLDYNGGYHILASLYGTLGQNDKVIACFEKLNERADYFSERIFNNFCNVIGYYYQYGQEAKIPELVSWIVSKTSHTQESIYDELVNRSGYIPDLFRTNYDFGGLTEEGNFYLNLSLGSPEQFRAICEGYIQAANNLSNEDRKNYLLSIHYKRMALFESKYAFDRQQAQNTDKWNVWFSRAVDHFRKVSPSYLKESESKTYSYLAGTRIINWSREAYFLYPDYTGSAFRLSYHSDAFYRYLLVNKLLTELYQTPEQIDLIYLWVANGLEVRPFLFWHETLNHMPLSNELLLTLLDFTNKHSKGTQVDKNLIYLVLSNRYFDSGDSGAGYNYFSRLDISSKAQWLNRFEMLHHSYMVNQLIFLTGNLAASGYHNEALVIGESLSADDRRIYAYIMGSKDAYEAGEYTIAFNLLDSALTKSGRLNATQIFPFRDFRFELISVMSKIGGEEMLQLAIDQLRSLDEQDKQEGYERIIEQLGRSRKFYEAWDIIPSTVTDNQGLVDNLLIMGCTEVDKERDSKFRKLLFFPSDWEYQWFAPGLL